MSLGADIQARTSNKDVTPLHFAAENGHLDTVKELVSLGADINAMDNCWIDTSSPELIGRAIWRLLSALVSLGAD